MSQLLKKYIEPMKGCSEAPVAMASPSNECCVNFVRTYTKILRKQNKRLKFFVNDEAGKHLRRDEARKQPKRDEAWHKAKEEEVLKKFTKGLKKQRKSIGRILKNVQPEDADIRSATTNINNEDTARESYGQISSPQTADEKHILKAAAKQMKKQEKLLLKAIKQRTHGKETAEMMPVDSGSQVQPSEGEKSVSTSQERKPFLRKVGDIVLKTLPTLLCVVAKSFFQFIFRRRNLRFGIT